MNQQKILQFDVPLHRERDRPPKIKPHHWSNWLDRVCVRGGVEFMESSLLRDFHECCPAHRAEVRSLADLTTVHMAHWEWYWDQYRSWLK